MKKILSIIVVAFSSVAFVACSNDKKAEKNYDDFKMYVVEHRDSADRYYDKEWSALEAEYNQKRQQAEAKIDNWNDEMRAEYASLQSDWDSFKEDFESEKMRRDNLLKNESMEIDIFPTGVKSDMKAVNASNLLNVHVHFVDYVSTHKDDLSREQWDRVELLWEALGTRKNEVEKELKSSDNIKIAEQKVRFGAIKAANRPSAKLEENAEAKQN